MYAQQTLGFNGATASEPWNRAATRSIDVQQRASMGPRHLSRGIDRPASADAPYRHGFNGATASEPWNPGECFSDVLALSKLQWGHGI